VEPGEEEVAGWGRHPVGRGRVERPEHLTLPAGVEPVVPRGLGRAYGDPALPSREGGLVLESTRADRIRSFEPATGRLHCEAGLSLAEILRVFVPRGWFPPVTPGTKFVTVGACVACDVHGKNHHRDGSFGSFVDRVTRLQHRDELRDILEPIFRAHTVAEWMTRLAAADVLCSPVNGFADLPNDPQVREGGMLHTVSAVYPVARTGDAQPFPQRKRARRALPARAPSSECVWFRRRFGDRRP